MLFVMRGTMLSLKHTVMRRLRSADNTCDRVPVVHTSNSVLCLYSGVQSSKLCVYEKRVMATALKAKGLPGQLAREGKVAASATAVAQLTGQVRGSVLSHAATNKNSITGVALYQGLSVRLVLVCQRAQVPLSSRVCVVLLGLSKVHCVLVTCIDSRVP